MRDSKILCIKTYISDFAFSSKVSVSFWFSSHSFFIKKQLIFIRCKSLLLQVIISYLFIISRVGILHTMQCFFIRNQTILVGPIYFCYEALSSFKLVSLIDKRDRIRKICWCNLFEGRWTKIICLYHFDIVLGMYHCFIVCRWYYL